MQEQAFPLKFFPKQLRQIILEVCEVFQFNPDFLAASILLASSSAIGNTFHITVKDGWIERNSLFLAIVASPGINKSAPLSWALKPLENKEKELYKKYKEYLKEFEADPENKDKPSPTLIKTIVSDATPEAVVQQLDKNERGILIYNDELSGFLNTFQRYSKGNDEQFYLSVWSGKPVVVDRKTSVSIRINEPVLNIVGTIQPSVFDKSFNTKEDSGFFDRWLIVNPKNAKKMAWTDDQIAPFTYDAYHNIINKLSDLTFQENQWGEMESQNLTYSADAWNLIKQWQYKNTSSINQTDMDHVRAIRAKMEIYVHRFCTIAHLIQFSVDDKAFVESHISEDSAGKGILLCDYFISNAITARSLDDSNNLTDNWKALYDSLPNNEQQFTYADFAKYAEFLDIPETSAKRWLKSQIGKVIIKIKHGTYSKK